jgi:hypothetical protein
VSGRHRGLARALVGAAAIGALACATSIATNASAQPYQQPYQPYQPYQPGYGQPGYGQPGYGQPGFTPQPGQYCPPGQFCPPGGQTYPDPSKLKSTSLEMGYLYGTAAAWGIGTGIWIDAEAEIDEPGFAILPPLVIGAAAAGGVAIADFAVHQMPRGVPSAIATGTLLGSGLGLGIAGYEAAVGNHWEFKEIMRSEFVGSTAGAVLGIVGGVLLRPSPKTNMFMLSAGVWGAGIGAAFGGGASNGDLGNSDQDILLGGLIGYGVTTAAAGTISIFWVPSWSQLGWMWAGFGIGAAATTPVYLFYIGSDADPRRGLIAQGVGGLLGAGLFALIGKPDEKGAAYTWNEPLVPGHRFEVGKILSGSIAPTPVATAADGRPYGFGAELTLTGVLY